MKKETQMTNDLLLELNMIGLDPKKVIENLDGSIDYDGDVDISDMRLDTIPIKFRRVYGNFDCSDNKLTSLRRCPEFVEGDFYCYLNELKNLNYGPKTVCGNYICSGNKLTSLYGSPKEIHGDFVCANNLLTDLNGSPDVIRGNLIATSNEIRNTIYLPKIIEKNFIHDIPVDNKYVESFSYIGINNYNSSTENYTEDEEVNEMLGDFDPDNIFIENEF